MLAHYTQSNTQLLIGTFMTTSNLYNPSGVDAYLRMKDLANIPERQPKTHTYKTGVNKGKLRVIGARPASRGIIGVSEKTIWEWVKQGTFPQPIRIGGNITAWRASDIKNWMQTQGLEG